MSPPLPTNFPPPWASDWGEDEFGIFIAFTYKGVRQVFRWIPAGTFMMGSPVDEPERGKGEAQHQVTISQGLWLADTTCTQELWEVVMGKNPSRFKGKQRPVENVSWQECNDFIDRLNSQKQGLDLRLPTEAEWEYGCRAGTDTPFSFGSNITTDQVNYDGDLPYDNGKKGKYRFETVEVYELPCNGWGLYQMHGNVWEWCRDWYGAYSTAAVIDPTGPDTGVRRVVRGGSWGSYAWWCRSAYRLSGRPGPRDDDQGFRLARGHVELQDEGRQAGDTGRTA